MKPLVSKKYLLERIQGKGGWTYALIPDIKQNKRKPFGMVKVKGSIDGFEIKNYNLMPMGNGNLFLPVKAEIRKQIKKKEGDYVHITLFHDNDPLEIPEELILCLQDEPMAYEYFNSLTESERNHYIQWIYTSKKEETKVNRIIKTIAQLTKRLKLHEKSPKHK